MATPQEALTDLLRSMFDEDELRQVLVSVEPGLRDKVTWNAPLAQVAFAAVEALGRLGAIDASLFKRLAAERPRRADEIEAVRRSFPSSMPQVGVRWGRGRYRLLELLGAGGFVAAWKAVDESTGEFVGIRILHPHLAEEERRRQRFRRGAETQRRLDHRNIARVIAADGQEGDSPYCVVEYVEGRNLGAMVGKAPIRFLLEVVAQIGEALVHVHEHGLVHRDVKPGNILVTGEGVGKLIDFDLVSVPSAMPLTATTGMGTPCFAAPEVLLGREDATPAADVYGLAATTLYVLTCGQFPGPTPQEPEVLLRSLPEDGALRRLLTAALQSDPRRRMGSALEFCRQLRGAASSLANTAEIILIGRPAPLRRPTAPEFAADGSLRIWEAAPGPLPPALEREGIRAWSVAEVEAAAVNRRRGTHGVAEVVPHLEELRIAGRLLALQGHRAAWLGLTATHAAVLVLPEGHVVLHEQGVPGEDELALARRCVQVEGAPVAIVRGWLGTEPPAPDIVGLSLAIREGAGNAGHLRRLARYARSPEAAAALRMHAREGDGGSRPASELLKSWASGPPCVAGVCGAPGSGRSHELRLLAAELAQAALSSGGRPVALIDVAGWQPPFRLAAVLRAQGFAPGECEGLRLAVEIGECTLLIDGVEVPGEPVEAASMVAQVKAEVTTWCGTSGRVLLAVGAHGEPLVRRLFELCAPDGAVTGVLHDVIEEDALRVRIRQVIVERGLLSLMRKPVLARALMDAAIEHRDVTTAHLSAPLGEYLRGWCTLAALHTPRTTATHFHGLLEALAALVWSQGEGVQREAILPSGVETVLRAAGWAGNEGLARRIVDSALLSRAPHGRCVVVDWLAAESQRRLPAPIRPYVPRGRRQVTRPAADAIYFVHNAILEHLLASRVVRELAAGRAEVLDGPRLSPGIRQLIRTMDDWSRAREIVGNTLASGYRRDISENALLLAIGDKVLASSREQPWQLADARLVGVNLRGAQLGWAQMDRADLTHADLQGAVLDDASLVGATLRRADLAAVSCVRVHATKADLAGGRLDASCWRDARLTGASVFASEARTAPPDLSGADLEGVDDEATLWRSLAVMATPDELLAPHAFRGARDAVWISNRKFVSWHASGHLVTWSALPLRPLRRWSVGPTQADRVALAADGRLLAGWKVGADLHLWDLETESECTPACLTGLRVVSAAWTRRGSRLAIVTHAGMLHVYEADSGALRTVAALGEGDMHVAFLPGDTRLVVWHAHAARMEVWDLEAGEIVAVIGVAKSEGGSAIVVSPDGRRVALKMLQHLCIVRVDDPLVLEALPSIPEFFSSLGAVDWSSDGRSVVLEFDNHGPVIGDLETGKWSHHLDQDMHRTSRLRFSPDGTLVLGSGNQAGDLLVWDARTGARLATSSSGQGWIRQVALGPDRRALLVVRGATLRVRGLPDLGLVAVREVRHDQPLVLMADGRGAVAVRENVLVIEDVDGHRRHVLDRSEERGDQVWEDMHASSDGSAMICTITDESRHEVAAWSMDTGGKIWSHPLERGSDGSVRRCHTVDPQRQIGISAGYHRGSGWIELRSAERKRTIAVEGQGAIVQLALDVARGTLACADDNGVITVWDLELWIGAANELEDADLRINCFELREPISAAMVFAPSGGVLAVPVRDQVRLFDVAAATPLRTLAGHRTWVSSLNFGGGGQWLISGDRMSEVRVWAWNTGRCLLTVCMASPAGDVFLSEGRYTAPDSPEALAGWMACAEHACIPLEMFDGALEGLAGLTTRLAEAFAREGEPR